MKILIALFFILILSCVVFAQTNKKKIVLLPSKLFKERIVKQEFPNVPQKIRDCHGRGTITLRILVNENGKTEAVNFISGICESKMAEYLEETISEWKFKPLEIDDEKVAFRGILQIPFCYGSFSNWCVS